MASSQGHHTRKLAVLMHADVAGSTKLVQQDESLAHDRIQDAFNCLSKTIARYSGSVLETRGDALIAEFARASDAVCAALSFQQINSEHNTLLLDSLSPSIRIGISLGEVVIADHTVTGSGVIVAQRIEQMAEPGGTYLSGAIYEAVPHRFPLDYSDLGKRELKGFDESVQVYKVGVKSGNKVPDPEPGVSIDTAKLRQETSKGKWIIIICLSALLIIVGTVIWLHPWKTYNSPSQFVEKIPVNSDQPSIVVLPFSNMSDNPAQEYFADGVTEDLTTDLSKVSGLFVIARNSAFAYKGKEVDIMRVAEELGVRYILEGSVRRAGNQLRINAQLIDSSTGGHLWAERYDGNLDDVFGLQDQVTRNVVTVLAVQLSARDQDRAASKDTSNTAAYDTFLQGWNEYLRQTPDSYKKAIAHFERAIKFDPSYSRAHAALAATYWQIWKRFWHTEIGIRRWHDARVRSEQLLSRAMNNPTALAYQLSSAMNLQRGRLQEAANDAEKAIVIDPNDPEGYIALAGTLSYRGDAKQAVLIVEHAMRLNPYFPQYYFYELGLAQFGLELFDQAASTFEKALELNSEDVWSMRMLLATYGQLERDEDTARILEKLSRMHFLELLSVKSALFWHQFEQPRDAERFAEGLRKAGVVD